MSADADWFGLISASTKVVAYSRSICSSVLLMVSRRNPNASVNASATVATSSVFAIERAMCLNMNLSDPFAFIIGCESPVPLLYVSHKLTGCQSSCDIASDANRVGITGWDRDVPFVVQHPDAKVCLAILAMICYSIQ